MELTTYILAGGSGERLSPLTLSRSKPAVPFGGIYRLIDFTLTNCIRSGLRKIYLLTQYRSESLQRHINQGWGAFNSQMGEFILPLPPQMRFGELWYQGTADAIFQNLYAIQRDKPDRVLILSGDHIYRMDYQKLISYHLARSAEITIVTFPVPLHEAKRFGVVEINEEGRILAFHEKPSAPPPLPGNPDYAMINMGVYIAETAVLAQLVSDDARVEGSNHDFGKNIFPAAVRDHRIHAFPFPEGCPDQPPFWMDVGTVDSYYDVSISMLDEGGFNLFNPSWPIHTFFPPLPPSILAESTIENSLISPGCHLKECTVKRSILGPGVTVEKGASIEDSILFDGVSVGSGSRIRKTISDKLTRFPEGIVIGSDSEQDGVYLTLTSNGVRVVKRGVDLGRLQETC